MRALKSILGSPLIDEETNLGDRKVPLREVVVVPAPITGMISAVLLLISMNWL